MIQLSCSDSLPGHNRSIHLPDPEQIVTVLSVGLASADRCCIRRIFQHSNWKLCEVETFDEATSLLRSARIPVILCGVDCHGDSWRNLIERVQSLASLPRPRVILALSDTGADLWSEALKLGVYDMLSEPLEGQEVIWVVSQAWLNWKGETGNPQEVGVHKDTGRMRPHASAPRPRLAK